MRIAVKFFVLVIGFMLLVGIFNSCTYPQPYGDEVRSTSHPSIPADAPGPDDEVEIDVYPEQTYVPALMYPKMAKTAGLQGTVFVKALVLVSGEVGNVVVAKSSGVPALDDAAVEQAWGIEYKPAMRDGRPVPFWVSYKVDFDLNEVQ